MRFAQKNRIALSLTKNERFARKTNERIPKPAFIMLLNLLDLCSSVFFMSIPYLCVLSVLSLLLFCTANHFLLFPFSPMSTSVSFLSFLHFCKFPPPFSSACPILLRDKRVWPIFRSSLRIYVLYIYMVRQLKRNY